MRFNPRARIDTSQVDDRSGQSGSGSSGGMRLPLPTGRGGLSIGGLVLAAVIYLVTQYVGGSGDGSTADTTRCATGADANTSDKCASELWATSVQDFWGREYPGETGKDYTPAKIVTYTSSTQTGCGLGDQSMGPFYCPNDQHVYIADSFLKSMLEGDLGAQGGPFALGYVVAHEYGHHIENLLGTFGKVRTQRGPTSDSVKLELMADCLGGMWAKDAQGTVDDQGQAIIEGLTQDDIDRAINAARSVGDDKLGAAEENWTHGSSAERVHWFSVGMKQGSIQDCDTFRAGAL